MTNLWKLINILSIFKNLHITREPTNSSFDFACWGKLEGKRESKDAQQLAST